MAPKRVRSDTPAVKKLRDALFALYEQRLDDEAADFALGLKLHVTRYSPLEVIADRIFKRRREDALKLYRAALAGAWADAGDATSGAEGLGRMVDVRRLEQKLAQKLALRSRGAQAAPATSATRTRVANLGRKIRGKNRKPKT